MCGIAGFVGKGTEDDARRMIAALRHRGPDHQGMGVFDDVALASARLAIIDLSPEGNQPMEDADNGVAVVFNGEIYNFQELRDDLLATGRYHFQGRSDTEVILYAYREYGERCFEKFNGMFAIALHDRRKKNLILARDRMGEKPLYYGAFEGVFLFGSELKAVLAHPCARREIDLSALTKYLVHGYVPTPHTILRGFRKLEPGTYLVWEGGRIARQINFWPQEAPTPTPLPFRESLSELERILDDSVKHRLVSDVPLGIFLSGGIDSSAIAYFAGRHIHAGKMKTFSIGFADKTFDETEYAREAARHLGSIHTEHQIKARDMLEMVPLLPDIADEPLADSSLIPTAILCRLARRDVTVALSGDGGDELFAGYPTFSAERIARVYAYLPHWLGEGVIPKIAGLLPVDDTYMSIGFRTKKFLKGSVGNARYRHHLWLGSFAPEELGMLFASPGLVAGIQDSARVFDDFGCFPKESSGEDPGNRMLRFYQRTYLLDKVLVKVDRASMAYSLEVRSPFLDHHLVAFMNQLPYRYKHRGLSLKYMLKKLTAGRIPPRIIHRKKKGFGAPVSRWLKDELRPLAEDMLLSARLAQDGFFNPRFVRTLMDNHLASRADNGEKLWTLLQFQLWRERWLPPVL